MPTRSSESGPLALDTNSLGAVTTTFDVLSGASYKSVFVVPKTGTHTIHDVQVEGSPDEGVTWFPMWATIVGKGMLMHQACECSHLRVKVIVAEGAASTCDVYLFSTD